MIYRVVEKKTGCNNNFYFCSMNRCKQIVSLFMGILFLLFSLNVVAVEKIVAPESFAHSTSVPFAFTASQQAGVYAYQEQRSVFSNVLQSNLDQGFSYKIPSWAATFENRVKLLTATLWCYSKESRFIKLRLQSFSIAFPFHEIW